MRQKSNSTPAWSETLARKHPAGNPEAPRGRREDPHRA